MIANICLSSDNTTMNTEFSSDKVPNDSFQFQMHTCMWDTFAIFNDCP